MAKANNGWAVSAGGKQQAKANGKKLRESIKVVVLGDIGHSPRMNYHALSLSKEGYEVNLIGYLGSRPQTSILEDEHITLTYMKKPPRWFESLPGIVSYINKVMWVAVVLFFTLITTGRSNKLLLQNPPAVPALPVCWFYCLITGSKLFVDWHNYGYTIMALSLSKRHPLVILYKFIERTFGKMAHGGFCVSKAMKDDLMMNWGICNVTVHYDRPPERFRKLTAKEKHNFYLKMSAEYPCFSSSSPNTTVFTGLFADGRVSFHEDRPALVVSSTSWTEDEDFCILFHALQDYERVRTEFPEHYPQLIVVVTGKGPMKEFYSSLLKSKNWQHVIVVMPWLTAEDYPKLLASSDLGVCLHYSSSGLDLPMKVVDMFGCGLPVAAIDYPALKELVIHNENGLIFKTKEELANLLQDWFRGFPKETELKETYYDFYKNIDKFKRVDWHSCWLCDVYPVISKSI